MRRLKSFGSAGVVLLAFFLNACTLSGNYLTENGAAFGTTYALTYRVPDGAREDFSAQILQSVDLCLDSINNSLSIYNNHSLIYRLNHNQTHKTDSLFNTVFRKALEINRTTNGAFDISAAPLFDLWGFGLEERLTVTPQIVTAALAHTGMDNFSLCGDSLFKKDTAARLSMNAIAKGYTSDLVAAVFDRSGVSDYLVEIGGEIVCKGKNSKGKPWAIGIDAPIDGNNSPGETLQGIVYLSDKALATSGNYRNFYVEDGKKYAHTIDPLTGYPVTHQLLSATVIAADCISADAYATAFMVMGLERSKAFLEQHPELGAFLIYHFKGKFLIFVTPNVVFK